MGFTVIITQENSLKQTSYNTTNTEVPKQLVRIGNVGEIKKNKLQYTSNSSKDFVINFFCGKELQNRFQNC